MERGAVVAKLNAVAAAKRAYLAGRGSQAAMEAAAEEYIRAIRAWAAETGRSLPIPTRAKVLRMV